MLPRVSYHVPGTKQILPSNECIIQTAVEKSRKRKKLSSIFRTKKKNTNSRNTKILRSNCHSPLPTTHCLPHLHPHRSKASKCAGLRCRAKADSCTAAAVTYEVFVYGGDHIVTIVGRTELTVAVCAKKRAKKLLAILNYSIKAHTYSVQQYMSSSHNPQEQLLHAFSCCDFRPKAWWHIVTSSKPCHSVSQPVPWAKLSPHVGGTTNSCSNTYPALHFIAALRRACVRSFHISVVGYFVHISWGTSHRAPTAAPRPATPPDLDSRAPFDFATERPCPCVTRDRGPLRRARTAELACGAIITAPGHVHKPATHRRSMDRPKKQARLPTQTRTSPDAHSFCQGMLMP